MTRSPLAASLALPVAAILLFAAAPGASADDGAGRCGCGRGHLPAAVSDPHAVGAPPASRDDPDDGVGGDGVDDAWDVNAPPLETYEITLDTTSGTWMSVDVHPDGTELVFDLLGDLYTLPIEGGDATPIAAGLAWDMQPRYSPDGTRIAFTSDRAGGDNIWTMNRDGSDPVQVSKESYRLVNSPVWSPDGETIAARKHFTSTRSLGSGEIWLYHRTGGDGLRLIEKPNEQKDLGEPAFSPDGRTVYFSQDTTPGGVFEYSKDSNGEIYTIRRIDLETGEVSTFLRGAGGAVDPTPSPDGRYLAFVRRVRFDTVLFVHDLETGENRAIHDRLDRDMQETWAVHGVYPDIAWTPDSREIVFWAGGGLHRVDVATGATREIPFRVRQKRSMVEALRTPVEVAPDAFETKMLRWVTVSPDGSQVVYQALGHLYLRDLPDGTPRRLTDQQDHFEFYPAWSRDGRSIVYTTWDDRDLGAVRVAPARPGSAGRVVVDRGHFVEPAFSPDGDTIVYRKIGAGYLRPDRYTREPGIYAVDADGGPPRLVTRNGVAPHFGADGDRLYFMTVEAWNDRALRSVALAPTHPDDRGERTHATSEVATEMRVSPDGRWIAFRERFHAYVTPRIDAAGPVALGPKTTSIPVARVTAEAGEYLHWSGDGRRLWWALGPELYHRDLTDAFAFLDGAAETLPDRPATGRNIGFEARTDVPRGTYALTGARVVTMKGDEVLEPGTVVVVDNRIAAVGSADEVDVPEGATVLDLAGKTVIPGLVDVHWHGAQGTAEITPERNWVNDASLAFGVTTLHDPSNDTSTIFAASEMARAGRIVAPRIYSTGTILYGASGDFKAEIDSLDDARFHLKRMQAVGAISVKSYNQPRRDQRQQVIAAAKELGMMVVPEGGSMFQHNMSMIVDGHTGVEHAVPVERMYDDVLQLWAASRTGYTPTLVVGYGGIWGERYWYQHTDVSNHERLMNFVPYPFVDPVARRRTMAPEREYNHVRIAENCKALSDRGVLVNLGAHGQREGLGSHWELWMLAQGGMSPLEVLRAGTLNGARYLGLDGDLGSIEPGKLADLAILDENPLENIRNTDSVSMVLLNGRLYDAATMDEIGLHPETREPLFFQERQRSLLEGRD